MNRKRLAAALAYVDEKAKRLMSLDQPKESDAVDMALEMGGSFIPGVGQALAARDFERARRAGDEAGMGMAAASALPVGRLIGALKGFDPVMREIDVYHGSPHVFDEFDASKIGTGEGAQAYGHGIYFAEKPDVARSYQFKRLTGDIKFDDGTQINVLKLPKNSPEKLAAQLWLTNPNLEEATQFVKSVDQKKWAGTNPEWAVPKERVLEELKKLDQKGAKLGGGAFYQADLPDEMVDRMLDYDLPIDQQNPYVLAALDRAGINTKSSMLAGPMAQGQEKHLAKFGIPGIKYLDEGSRGKSATKTRNFVVFPGEEKKVKILKRE